jgi:spore coat polysaccharide biosynthesis predicted glycosyltransferase SpsG
MEALAAELEARGFRCPMVPLGGTKMVAGRVAVIDSYRMRADDPGRVRAGVVIAIDDLVRDLVADLVVDPSPGAEPAVHNRATKVLAGAPYALLHPPAVEPVGLDAAIGRVLVTTGAADIAGAGCRLAASVLETLPDAHVRLVVGPWGSGEVPAGVVAVHARGGLHAEMAAADLVVTAGGVAMLEACALGRPTIAVVLADNQRQAVAGLEAAGAIAVATVESIADVAQALAGDPTRRSTMASIARTTIDGKGAARVADAIEELIRS